MQSLLAPKAVFDQAIALINSGDLGGAESRCRTALAEYPRDVNMLALLGALLIKLDRPEEAESKLRQAIAEAPTFAKPHEDLGHLLVQRNRAAEALPVLERATHLDATLEKAWFTLGRALAMLGRGADADVAFERSFALSPERRLMALAAEHQKEARYDEAEHLYRRVLRHNPRNVDALRLLALVAMRAERADEAESLLERAIAIAPDFIAAILDLGRLRKEQDRYGAALECFDKAIAIDPGNAQAHYLRAATFAPASFSQEAIDAYQQCLKLKPNHVVALLGLGHVLKAVGRYDESVASYAECIRQSPESGETYWSLANLKTYRFDDPTVAGMGRRVAGAGLGASSEVHFLFALGKAWEDRAELQARTRDAAEYDGRAAQFAHAERQARYQLREIVHLLEAAHRDGARVQGADRFRDVLQPFSAARRRHDHFTEGGFRLRGGRAAGAGQRGRNRRGQHG